MHQNNDNDLAQADLLKTKGTFGYDMARPRFLAEAYLLEPARYIVLNPVRARMVHTAFGRIF